MATVSFSKKGEGIQGFVTGSFTGDASAVIVSVGFNPTAAFVINETDVIAWEKIDPMAAANTFKTVAAGTKTLDTGSAIVFNGDGTVTLSATLGANAKAIKFRFER